MKRSELIVRCKLQIPNIKETGLNDEQLATLLSQGVDEVNMHAKVYKTYTDFAIVAEQQIYNLSTIAASYLGMDKKGVFFKDSSSQWREVYAKTSEWIRSVYPNWLNVSSVAVPKYFWVDGDELGFYEKPSTSLANGGRIYHLKKSTPMTNNDHYPFTGSATEITAFRPLDDAIIAYVRWKVTPAFGQNTDQDLRELEFKKECRRGAMQVRRRPDLWAEVSNSLRLC
jgi:hypothetical protein